MNELKLFVIISLFLFSCENNSKLCKVRDADCAKTAQKLLDQYGSYLNDQLKKSNNPVQYRSIAASKLNIIDQLVNFNNRIVVRAADGYHVETGEMLKGCSSIKIMKYEIDHFYTKNMEPSLNNLNEDDKSTEKIKELVTNFFINEQSNYVEDYYDLPLSIYHQKVSDLIVEIMFVDLINDNEINENYSPAKSSLGDSD